MKRTKPLSKSNQQKMNAALTAFFKPLDSDKKEPKQKELLNTDIR
jgi:hypothetical protein